jgi:hypothetical protein
MLKRKEKCNTRPELEFVNLLRSPWIDSQPGWSVRQPYLTYRPPRSYIGWRNRYLGIDSWAPWMFTKSGLGAKPFKIRYSVQVHTVLQEIRFIAWCGGGGHSAMCLNLNCKQGTKALWHTWCGGGEIKWFWFCFSFSNTNQNELFNTKDKHIKKYFCWIAFLS